MLTLKQLTATYPHHLVIELYNIFYLRETEGSTWGHPRFLVGSVSLIGLDFCICIRCFPTLTIHFDLTLRYDGRFVSMCV
jgi:hypothetical protein